MTIGFLFCAGALTLVAFVVGWVSAEACSGRVAERARFDREQRRLRALHTRQRAEAARRTGREDGA